MSVYKVRNIISKFLESDIRILYARPKEIAINKEILNNLGDNIVVYDITKILDVSWLSYDMLLTHQINNQIMELSNNLHVPIVCYSIDGVEDNYQKQYPNTYYIEKGASVTDLVSIFESIKYKRFIL